MIVQALYDALDGKRGPDQQRIAETGLKWLETLLAKNSDYGSSAWKSPVLAPQLDAGEAIKVRMSDKIERLSSLANKPAEVTSESYRDTVSDLGSYCLLWLCRPVPVSVKTKVLKVYPQAHAVEDAGYMYKWSIWDGATDSIGNPSEAKEISVSECVSLQAETEEDAWKSALGRIIADQSKGKV